MYIRLKILNKIFFFKFLMAGFHNNILTLATYKNTKIMLEMILSCAVVNTKRFPKQVLMRVPPERRERR